jgi:hypothetical protein
MGLCIIVSCRSQAGGGEGKGGVQWRREAPGRQHRAGIYNSTLLPLYPYSGVVTPRPEVEAWLKTFCPCLG